jgi:alpha-1,2-mannosyltransferase
VLAVRYRSIAMAAVSLGGVALTYFAPSHLMIEHEETSAALWRQLVGGSYVWWALALIVASGTVTLRRRADVRATVDAAPVHASS